MAIVVRSNKDGSTSYLPRVRDSQGSWFKAVTFSNRGDAVREEQRLLDLKGKGAKTTPTIARETTVDEYWQVWSVDRRTETSLGWKISQDQMYRDYVKPVLGRLTLIQVRAPEIGHVMARCKELGKAPQTRKHVYTLMRQMFGDAVEYYEMLVKSPVLRKHHLPKVPKSKRSFLTPEQSWQLVKTAWAHGYMGPPVTVMVLSALRCEAMMGLKWDSVLWDSNQLLIKRAWKQKEGRMADYPKGKDWEYVPMTPVLRDYLNHIWQTKRPDPEDFVCPGIKGGMIPYETYLHALRRLCRAAEVPVMTPHELRHSCTEIFMQNGACSEDVRRLLNHKSLSAVGPYIHRTEGRLNEIASKIDKPELRLVRVNTDTVHTSEQKGGLPSDDSKVNLN